jgi:hypothetical protein
MRYHFKMKAKSLVCVRQERMAGEGTSEYYFNGQAFAGLAELQAYVQKYYLS